MISDAEPSHHTEEEEEEEDDLVFTNNTRNTAQRFEGRRYGGKGDIEIKGFGENIEIRNQTREYLYAWESLR